MKNNKNRNKNMKFFVKYVKIPMNKGLIINFMRDKVRQTYVYGLRYL